MNNLESNVDKESMDSRCVPGDGRLQDSWRNANVPDGFTLVAVGDLVIGEALSWRLQRKSSGLLELLQGADITFGNFESTAIDLNKFGGWPEAEPGGSWLVSSPQVPHDLRAMGFDLLSRANNHATDWGVAGMRYTDALLDEAGIVHAGTGCTLAEARMPKLLCGPAGRVSLVAAASRFQPMSRAADPLGQVPGRPGVNALRTTRSVLVPPDQFDQLVRIRDAQPSGSVKASVMAADARDGTVTLFGTKYRVHPDPDGAMAFTFSMHDGDLQAILRSIRQGKQTADFSVVSMHTHEPGNYSDVPPDFLPTFARQAIDNGADVVIAHGPHRLRGIEIYKKKAIFYSLGNFFFMENTYQPLTREAFEGEGVDPSSTTEAELLEKKRMHGVFRDRVWYESIVAAGRYDSEGNLTELRLHPVEMNWSGARDADRGIPCLAGSGAAERILGELQRLSQPYGTEIEIERGIGVVRIGLAGAIEV